jgi:prepilin-type N-terminal cleavage/methylation domain-containing protein
MKQNRGNAFSPPCRPDGLRACDGFTLIELLVVVSLIIVIAAVAIPNLQRSRLTANEGAAIGALRTIANAESQFQSQGVLTYPSGMGRYGELADLAAMDPPLIDAVLATGMRQGYRFLATPGGVDGSPSYAANADPIVMNGTGGRGFYVDETAVIRFMVGGSAGVIDSPL